jgi:hypothetical protein
MVCSWCWLPTCLFPGWRFVEVRANQNLLNRQSKLAQPKNAVICDGSRGPLVLCKASTFRCRILCVLSSTLPAFRDISRFILLLSLLTTLGLSQEQPRSITQSRAPSHDSKPAPNASMRRRRLVSEPKAKPDIVSHTSARNL